MKKDRAKLKAAAGGILFILAVVFSVLAIAFYFTDRASASAPPEGNEFLYQIVDYNGKVSVVRRGEEKPYQVFDTYTNSLPEIDQQELKNGVKIYSDAQLQQAIEDYTS